VRLNFGTSPEIITEAVTRIAALRGRLDQTSPAAEAAE
jgi:hypothetical protein